MKLCFAFLLALLPLAAQTPRYRAPPADGGHPDLNGIWQALNEGNYDIEAHNAKPAMAVRPGPYGPVPAAAVLGLGAVGSVPPGMGVVEGGDLPYKGGSAGTEKQKSGQLVESGSGNQVLLAGVPRATNMPYPFRIFQNGKNIFIAYEYDGAVRNIYLQDPGPAPVDSSMGQSVGRWEGETLLVDVTGLNDRPGSTARGIFTATRCV